MGFFVEINLKKKLSDLSKLSKPYFKECKNKIGSNILKVKKEKYFKENLKVFMLKIVGKKCTIFGSGKPLLWSKLPNYQKSHTPRKWRVVRIKLCVNVEKHMNCPFSLVVALSVSTFKSLRFNPHHKNRILMVLQSGRNTTWNGLQ